MSEPQENDSEQVWETIKKAGICMVITRDGESLQGRPLQPYPEPEHGKIFFMTDSDRVLSQIENDPRVMLSFSDKGGNNYASVNGVVAITNDRAKIKELWTPWAEAFWDGPDDPKIRVLEFSPDHARYWDAPNALVTSVLMLAGAVTKKPPPLGASGEIDL